MKTSITSLLLTALLSIVATTNSHAQGTAFTYQGRLNDGPSPANGSYDLKFTLFDSLQLNSDTFGRLTNSAVTVSNGLFTTLLDFGPNVFTGHPNFFLEMAVRRAGGGPFITLNPRQHITPTPYAIYAANAAHLANGAVSRLNNLTDNVTLAAGQNVTITPSGNTLTIASPGGGSGPWQLNGNNTFYNGGKVGVGTAAPVSRFHVTTTASDNPASPRVESSGTDGFGSGWDFYHGAVGKAYVGVPDVGAAFAPGELLLFGAPGTKVSIWPGQNRTLTLDPSGTVGIGTTTPRHKLSIAGGPLWTANRWKGSIELENDSAIAWQANAAGQRFGIGSSHGGLYLFHTASDPGTTGTPAVYDVTISNSGNVGIGTGDPQAKLDVAGSASVQSLTITGGADLAEPFPMKEEIEKGSVVIIDREHPGRLKLSTRAYDTQVAGIVSGANGIHPGIALKQEGVLDQGRNVALTGRVYVKADASHGAIKPGDLLTTSDTPGHAMKVGDEAKSHGAILGKAMSELGKGTGLVLVLVTLQ